MKKLFLIFGLLGWMAACSSSGGNSNGDTQGGVCGPDSLVYCDTTGQDTGDPQDTQGDTAPQGDVTSDGTGDLTPNPDAGLDTAVDTAVDTAIDTPQDTPQDTLWTDCSPYCTAPDGINWVFITGGTFDMGCSAGDSGCADHEKPTHSVTVAPFMMMDTELTEGQYQALTGTNPSFAPKGADYPVENLTWEDARVFCEAIGGRLPTEAEWEFAARGGTTTKHYCDTADCVLDLGWVDTNSDKMKHPVKQKTANLYGLYDTVGNVWEWVSDWYAADYYATSPTDNPPGPETGTEKVARGGSFLNLGSTRVSARYHTAPTSAFDTMGLRCAK
jgi:formylglycine-generating enzyme required for sulfatase activity